MRRCLIIGLCVLVCLAVVTLLCRQQLVLFARTHKPFHSIYFYVWNRVKSEFPFKLPAEVGNHKPASEIEIQYPMGIVETSRNEIVFSDRGRYVWAISPEGTARVIAGTGYPGFTRSGVIAVEAQISSPEGLCIDQDDNIYYADSKNHVVKKIHTSGKLVTVAGTNLPGYRGDSGPADKAWLNRPYDVAIDSQGNLYIADYANDRIRKVNAAGIISTFAGTGDRGFSGDGGPAAAAKLRGPYGVCVDVDGNVIIADSENHRIRRVDRDGVIQTIAGTGDQGYSGDGGPAIEADFDTPQAVLAAADGRLFIGDEHNHCIRIVEVDGTISTFVGDGQAGFAGDRGHRAQARLNDPEGVLVCADGRVVITDGENGRLRVIAVDGTISTFAGRGKAASAEGS